MDGLIRCIRCFIVAALQGMVNGLMDRTRGGGAVASGPIESLVPDVPVRTLPGAHEGGCYTLAFDRCAPAAPAQGRALTLPAPRGP